MRGTRKNHLIFGLSVFLILAAGCVGGSYDIGEIGNAKNVILYETSQGNYYAKYTWVDTVYMVEGIEKTEGDPPIVPISAPFEDSMVWIKENTPTDSVILSWWDYGDYIRLFGSRETVASDVCESELCLSTFAGEKEDIFRFDSDEKITDLAMFFTANNEEDALEIARKYNVDYVMVTYEEFGKSSAINQIAQNDFVMAFQDIPVSGDTAQDEEAISNFLAQNGLTSYHIVNLGNGYRIWFLEDNGKPEMKNKLLAKLLPFNTGHGQGLEHFELVYSKYGYIWIYKID